MRNLLWLACVAVAAKRAHSHVDAALGGGGSRGTRPLLEKVWPRDQDEVSQHKTESADVEHAELADAHKGGDAIDAAARWDGDPAASIKNTFSHEDAPKDTKSKAETAYASGGHARPVLEQPVAITG